MTTDGAGYRTATHQWSIALRAGRRGYPKRRARSRIPKIADFSVHLGLFVALLTCPGCAMPLDKVMQRTAGAKSAKTAQRTRVDGQAFDAAQSLRVGDEVLTPKDVWESEGINLDRARAEGERSFRMYVERRAARLITDRITASLLYQHATARIPERSEETLKKIVDGELRRIITTDHGGVQRRYERHLAKEGLTLEDMRSKLRREIVVSGYLERTIKPQIAEPTRVELMEAFRASKDEYTKPARRRLSMIDIRMDPPIGRDNAAGADGVSGATRETARSLARTVEVELRNGGDFAELARRHSNGLHAAEGGSWGWVTKDSVRERFRPAVDALFRLAESEVSHLIETPEGFFIVRCDEIDPATTPTFEALQPRLKQRHSQERYRSLISELITELRRKSNIAEASLERFHASCVATAMKP